MSSMCYILKKKNNKELARIRTWRGILAHLPSKPAAGDRSMAIFQKGS